MNAVSLADGAATAVGTLRRPGPGEDRAGNTDSAHVGRPNPPTERRGTTE
ncbi:hypothetical protein FHR81_002139 [Actinoalloteichus hoggarensis]|uniref:Uncharacterized protein n=1 Tax=Actinoalloteichus hoggarensis TaxID=1470176 RepID=A0A221W5F7_9PSEU|nr:hypothetical protein AHOG_17735 [Actinoalloteichus hoggarensis]MBB5921101.1 hypothetical protein [Actinoalloteichus hoggarensis]